MKRRQFLTASLAASAAALVGNAAAQQKPAGKREYYQLRRYELKSGPQSKMTEQFFAEALIPAVSRMGMGTIGAFRLDVGPETPQFYLLIPGSSAETLATLDLQLANDEEFLKAAAPYWNATAAAPAFQRIETSLLIAFEGWPKITPPASAATKGKRIFQLRTYESPSNLEHIRKVEMFHSGEFEYFQKSGCHPVFFGDTLFGSRMPCLTYMLSFPDQAALDEGWIKFRNDPGWKELSADPRFAFDPIVINISNLVLSPLSCSQV
jgi:hypothetical protein